MKYEVHFDYNIQRFNDASYTSNSNSQGRMWVEAQGNTQAENLVRAMYGGHNNCQIRTVVPKNS
jgi:hypothetical protein